MSGKEEEKTPLKSPKTPRKCSHCKKEGHTISTCSEYKKLKQFDSTNKNILDILIFREKARVGIAILLFLMGFIIILVGMNSTNNQSLFSMFTGSIFGSAGIGLIIKFYYDSQNDSKLIDKILSISIDRDIENNQQNDLIDNVF